jgi:hypothetical protein
VMADDNELIELVELMAATALHHSITMTVSIYVRQFGWSPEVASKVVELAAVAHERGREDRSRWRNKPGPKPAVELETAGGTVGEELIRSYYRIGLNGPKQSGRPSLTVNQAINDLQKRKHYRHKENHRADEGDNSARGRARAYLREWLKSHYWLRPYVDRYGFGCPLPAPAKRMTPQ